MNTKAKGNRAERRCMKILTDAGYSCSRAAASLGIFDVVAIGAADVRLVQVKAGSKYCSAIEREQIARFVAPPNCSREIWRFPDRCKEPLIERIAYTA
jgi:Holliday junction resolvase